MTSSNILSKTILQGTMTDGKDQSQTEKDLDGGGRYNTLSKTILQGTTEGGICKAKADRERTGQDPVENHPAREPPKAEFAKIRQTEKELDGAHHNTLSKTTLQGPMKGGKDQSQTEKEMDGGGRHNTPPKIVLQGPT